MPPCLDLLRSCLPSPTQGSMSRQWSLGIRIHYHPYCVDICRRKKVRFFFYHYFLWQQTQSVFFQAVWKPAHTFVHAQLFCLIFTKVVEAFAFKTVGESEVLRALMSPSWSSHFHMSCHLTEVWVQGKMSSQPLSMQTFACALQLLSFAPEVSSVATPCINNTNSESSVFSFTLW